MKDKTLKELRELAKARGLRGYSKLGKDELAGALAGKKSEGATAAKSTTAAAPAAANKAPRRSPAVGRETAAKSASAETARPPAPARADTARAPSATTPLTGRYASAEELVEGAKYALRPNGGTPPLAADLGEDIDRLPTLAEPVVCLLPQKPGILHAYWVLPAGETASGEYKLRLCRTGPEALAVCEEIPVRGDSGSWYFHVDEQPGDGGLLVQLGYYRDGVFRSARGRSIARLPNLYASARTDERWWVREQDFLQMYLRAGGFVTAGHRFAWAGSIGSPGAAAPPAEQRLVWPGGVSST